MGIFERGGAPVERAMVEGLVRSMEGWGPDAQRVWSHDAVGLGHATLRTTWESQSECQPASLNEELWITADVRLDARHQLIKKLRNAGREISGGCNDADLVLQSYAEWGVGCVEHLRGDFAFAIWDATERRLFCARDHFGIKPFYYAEAGSTFVFSNALNSVRLHPDVSDELNDAAMGDFLLFGLNCDKSRTTFRDVRRLEPGHCMTVSAEDVGIRRYWAPPKDGRIRYKHADEYVEHFRSLLAEAVDDRLRTDRVGILMSGGLDSTAVAATAKEISAKSSGCIDLQSCTFVYRSVIADSEGRYAREAAEHLGIPNEQLAMDHWQPFEACGSKTFSSPEPVDNPFLAGALHHFRVMSGGCRVWLSGDGADDLMHFQMKPYVEDLCRNKEWLRLATELSRYGALRPPTWKRIRRQLKKFSGKGAAAASFPSWIAPEFAERLRLKARWEERRERGVREEKHPVHPEMHASLDLPNWTLLFELESAGVTQEPVEVRYPFLDLRIAEFLLAIPPFPWFYGKKLLRDAMVGRLPESVRTRPKTPVQGDALLEQLRDRAGEEVGGPRWNEKMDRYVDRSKLTPLTGKMDAEEANTNARAYCATLWMDSAQRAQTTSFAETQHG